MAFGQTKEVVMKLREIVAPTMKELIKKEIIRQILQGECTLGEKLPTEREMEKKMNVQIK